MILFSRRKKKLFWEILGGGDSKKNLKPKKQRKGRRIREKRKEKRERKRKVGISISWFDSSARAAYSE